MFSCFMPDHRRLLRQALESAMRTMSFQRKTTKNDAETPSGSGRARAAKARAKQQPDEPLEEVDILGEETAQNADGDQVWTDFQVSIVRSLADYPRP